MKILIISDTRPAWRIGELEAELQQLQAAHKDEVDRLAQQVNESDSRAAAEDWKALKWGENYKAQELELAAPRTQHVAVLSLIACAAEARTARAEMA
jgi:hypothetical protein